MSWGIVKTLSILCVALNLCSKQVDYTNAFVQAPIDTEVFIEIPRLFTRHSFILELKKNLYGLVQSPLN